MASSEPGSRSSGVGAGPRPRPSPGATWQWQLDGALDLGVDAQVIDVDYQTTSAEQVAELHRQGRWVVCYVDIGAVESYRPDAGSFPPSVVGRAVDGWPRERYLDIRRLDVVGPLLGARLDTCRAKGFDGVEGDLVDAYDNDSGFPITADDEVRFLNWFADAVHARGMAAGLKNVPDLVPRVVGRFDFAVVEDCFRDGVCAAYRPFTAAGKPVFDAEYERTPDQFCAEARRLGISAIAKRLGLDSWRQVCP